MTRERHGLGPGDRSSRRQAGRFSAGLLVVVLLAAACSSSKDESGEADPRPCSAQGKLIGIAGQGGDPDRAVSVQLCPFEVATLVEGGSFTAISAAGSHILVSGNPDPAGVDRVFRLADGKLEPLPGIGEGAAHLPVISAQGRIAYYLGRHAEAQQHTIQLLDSPDDTTPELVQQVVDLSSISVKWDGERLVYLRVPGANVDPRSGTEVDAAVTTIWPPDARGDRPIRVPWPSGIITGAEGRIGVMYDVTGRQPRGWVVDGAGTRHPLPEGWYPVSFEPNGGRLVVAAIEGAQVGLVSPPKYDSVTVLGSSPVGRIWFGDWVS